MEPNRPERTRRERRALDRRKTPRAARPASGAAIGAGLAGLAALAAGGATPADAATFTVTTLADSGAGSLRQAITDANGAAGADTIDFQAGLLGTILLTTGQLEISDSVTIQGPGAASISVSGNSASRVFYLYNPSSMIDVTISGLTIDSGAAGFGAGLVDFDENLTLDDVTIRNNNASSSGGGLAVTGGDMALNIQNSRITGNIAGNSGGGIYVATAASVAVKNSTIANNTASNVGGGVYFYLPVGPAAFDGTTISGNTAAGPGGGVEFFFSYGSASFTGSTVSGNSGAAGGGVFFYLPVEPLTVENCTVSGNQATVADGGGIYLYNLYTGSSELRHTTIAGNSAAGNGGGLILRNGSVPMNHMILGDNTAAGDADLSGGTFDLSYSLVEAPGSATINDIVGNVLNQDPQLAALANNGGTTETQLPAAASPAVDSGDPAFAPPPATDQRGLPRVFNGRIDMGAVEVGAPLAPGTIQLTMTTTSVAENAGTVTITATRTGGTDGAVSVTITSANGSAIAPGDYGAIPGGTMLSWADGDGASKSINVTIVNDTDPEPDETFSVSISAPTGGATLGSATTEQVTILSDPADDLSVIEVPTLGDFGKVLFAALTAAAGFLLLRRKKGLAAPALVVTLALGALPAEAARMVPQEVRATTLAQLSTQGNTVTVRLADGTVYHVTKDHFVLLEGRKGRRGRTPGTLSANQPIVLKMRRAADGTVRRMRIVLEDSAAAAQAEATKTRAVFGHAAQGKAGQQQ
ncbi:MAG: choice-of-anchor Q domain-containing protein [Acidobacteriota bacterium]